MPFAFMLAITAIVIAGSAAFFSVYGLAQVYNAAMVPVIIMGAALEAGKLIAASFLYRNWNKIGLIFKSYLVAAVLMLMLITSMGIFGYLTAAYQKDTIPLKDRDQQISLYEDELTISQSRKEAMDVQISQMPATYVSAKQKLIATFQPEYEKLNPRINFLTTELQKLKQEKITVETKIGPIIFIAQALGKEPDIAVFWFTLIIILVFDPLAVALTIAANMTINDLKRNVVPVMASTANEQAAPDNNSGDNNMQSTLSDITTKLDSLLDSSSSQKRKQDIINSTRTV